MCSQLQRIILEIDRTLLDINRIPQIADLLKIGCTHFHVMMTTESNALLRFSLGSSNGTFYAKPRCDHILNTVYPRYLPIT